ncbi:MAG: betaine--homocysteine S-methyltransferase, partial [Actinomycetota bacterium]|nr:betaine--homocysteine S-methyltransferase [Actinomycetota bacterium]
MNAIADLLQTRGVIVGDGGMGTELFVRGLTAGDPPERWNVEQGDLVSEVHAAYIEAGADLVLTNSFGGTCFRLALHGLQDQVFELNRAAAEVARRAADASGRQVIVAGSMGPSGELLVPMGSMTPEQARAGFAEQARGLAAGGADVLWIETMSDLDEVACAIEGARSACDLPICATLSFDTAGRTMMGITGADLVARLRELDVAAMGANCGNNIADTEAAVREVLAQAPGVPIISKANAGIPEFRGDQLQYDGTPEVMAAHAHRIREAGAQIIGACCGSTPEHIAYMAGVLNGELPVPAIE